MKIRSLPVLPAIFVVVQTFSAALPALAQPAAPQGASVPSARELKHPSRADRQLVKAVRRRLARTAGLNPSNVSVLAHDGVVVLTGSVPTQNEADLAASTAARLPDVTSVVNRLTIRAPL